MNCEFCEKEFNTISSLNHHKKTAKYCLKIQKKDNEEFKCMYCLNIYATKDSLSNHLKICRNKDSFIYKYLEDENIKLKDENIKLKEENIELKLIISKLEAEINIYKKDHETISDIAEKYILKNQINNQDMTFKLILENGEVMDIGIRSDGYINATQLCKAGGKAFADYQKTKQTQDYLQALSSVMNIPITELIDIKHGGIDQGTYVHRKIGYHMSQWISSYFSVQVSNVLDNLFITGRVELGNEKNNSELEYIYQEKINNLQNKLKNYETTIFNRNIDYCPIEYYGKDIVYFLKFNIPVHLYDEYISKYPNMNNKDYSCVEFGVSSDIEKRLISHKRDKKKDDIIFLHAIELKKRYTASKMEYYIKTIAQQLNIKFEYEKKKECVLVNEEMFNVLVNKINTGLSNLEDIEETDIEDERIDVEDEHTKYKYEIKKVEMITELFKNKLLTFDEYKNILETIR